MSGSTSALNLLNPLSLLQNLGQTLDQAGHALTSPFHALTQPFSDAVHRLLTGEPDTDDGNQGQTGSTYNQSQSSLSSTSNPYLNHQSSGLSSILGLNSSQSQNG